MSLAAIAARELRSQFLSPLAWTTLGLVKAVFAYALLLRLEQFVGWQPRLAAAPGAPGVTELVVAPALGTAGFLLLLVAPLVTMRALSEERRAGTLALLMSAPLSMTEIVLGKFLALAAIFACLLLVIALLPLALLAGGPLDLGLLAAGLLGLALLALSLAAAGLFLSALTPLPALAAVGSLGLFLLLWILGSAPAGDTGQGPDALAALSPATHFGSFARGLVDTRAITYFALFTVTFLALTVRHLERLRREH